MASFPSSYIKTEASSVTRNADLPSITGTNFSEWFRHSEGTLFVDYDIIPTDAFSVFVGIAQGADERWATIDQRPGNNIRAVIRHDSEHLVEAIFSGGPSKVAIGVKGGDHVVIQNGSIVGSSNNSGVPTGSTGLYVGSGPHLVGTLENGAHIRKIQYYPHRLTNVQLQALTRG